MPPAGRHRRNRVLGFTLIEALVAIALMGVIMAALASITSQWLPNWNRGINRAQQTELLGIALDRLVADLAASEFISSNSDSKGPLFDGTEFSVTLVRSALGPNLQHGLEIVHIAETAERTGAILVRSTKPFAPFDSKLTPIAKLGFVNPIVLLRAPYRLSFAYAGRDGIWKNTWQNADSLPSIVRVTVRDAATGHTLPISTTALVHVEIPAGCAASKKKEDCAGRPGTARSGQSGNNSAPTISAGKRT